MFGLAIVHSVFMHQLCDNQSVYVQSWRQVSRSLVLHMNKDQPCEPSYLDIDMSHETMVVTIKTEDVADDLIERPPIEDFPTFHPTFNLRLDKYCIGDKQVRYAEVPQI